MTLEQMPIGGNSLPLLLWNVKLVRDGLPLAPDLGARIK